MTKIAGTRRAVTAAIKEKALELGYASCGITDVSPFPEFLDGLDARVRRYPESARLYEELRDNAYPKKRAAWAESMIVCISRYGKYRLPHEPTRYFGKTYLVDGRVPYAPEYRAVEAFEEFLKGLGFSVTVPRVAARWAAVRAGLGQFGKNNFVYTDHGSWVSIKIWLVDAVLEYDALQAIKSPCPEKCTRCIDACPTQALGGPFAMNFSRCISHLSYHLKGLPPEAIRRSMGTWMYGCDACQDSCPLNHGKWGSAEEYPRLESLARDLTLDRLFRMTQAVYEEVIQPRFWYIGKEDLWMWKSNALRAMANSGDAAYRPLIEEACTDPHEHVREMALWARDAIRRPG